jgi:hypothetical protein
MTSWLIVGGHFFKFRSICMKTSSFMLCRSSKLFNMIRIYYNWTYLQCLFSNSQVRLWIKVIFVKNWWHCPFNVKEFWNPCKTEIEYLNWIPSNVVTDLSGILALALSLVFVFKLISTFNSQNPKFSFMHVLTKDVLLLWP